MHKLAPAATFARAQKKSVFRTVLLTFFDTLSDYATYIVLANTRSSYATPMLVVLLGSMVTQASVVHFITNEGPIAIAAALLGLKPILDGVNIVFDLPARPGANDSLVAFGYTRATETSTESIPFVVMQALALMEHQSIAQWLSFGISVSNIAHAVASVDYSFDASFRFRNIEPLCYGCYPPGAKGDGLFASISVFAFGYVTAKLVAMATLGAVSSGSLALMLIAESIALLLMRAAIGNWRFFNPAGESTAMSLFIHFLCIFWPQEARKR